jgi:hypothetical protein
MREKLLDRLVRRLKTIEENYGYLSFLINWRYRNEKWLQLETMLIISSMREVTEYLPEKHYNLREKCDFWFKTRDGVEHWMEIKMCPTNYRPSLSRIRHSKAITDSVSSVMMDIERLKRYAPPHAGKHILFTFYPLYPESRSIFNTKHLSKISNACGRIITSPNRQIQVGDAFFDIHLIDL